MHPPPVPGLKSEMVVEASKLGDRLSCAPSSRIRCRTCLPLHCLVGGGVLTIGGVVVLKLVIVEVSEVTTGIFFRVIFSFESDVGIHEMV